MRLLLQSSFIILFLLIIPSLAQTGKITGTINDSTSGEPLIGANVIIEGTSMGAATNTEGYYVIINVSPDQYNVKISSIGYSPKTFLDVEVNINQTTVIDASLQEQSIETEEVVVIAQTPIVQKDVSASIINLDVEQIESLPVSSIEEVIGLQAGVEEGLIIRGGSANQTGFMINGITLRDERNNSPFTGISYTSVDKVQIQTGGFNAEYGDVRSGLINVVTKEGAKDKYYLSFIGRYSGASAKHFGSSPQSKDSYWIRPYVDPEVAWTGTGAWDEYTQMQYPEFEGWIAVANKRNSDDDPTNDLTPEAAQKIFLWEHRRQLDIVKPDYDIDASFGGPFPFAGKYLGDLRFFASYRQIQKKYVIPLSTDGMHEYTGQLKLTSDIGQGMKLMVQGLRARTEGTNDNNAGLPGIFEDPIDFVGLSTNNFQANGTGPLTRVSYIDARMFAPDYWAPSTIDRYSYGTKFTHVINPTTFYEISLSGFTSEYSTNPGRDRDTSKIITIGGISLDEAPFGFADFPSTGIVGLRMGVGFSNSRDSSKITAINAKFDIQSQLDKYNEVKTGLEFTYTDNYVNYASIDVFLPSGRYHNLWHTYPLRGAFYVQDKLEFEGMVANIGVRFDYSDPGGKWFDYTPFTQAFSSTGTLDTLVLVSTEKQLDISPRLGISFPITDDSKLYFNYGHFRQLPTPDDLYLIRKFLDNNALTRLANPNNPLEKTVAYELGFEQNIYDQFLLHLAGYYKDVSLQSRLVTYVSRDSKVNYDVTQPDNYADIRGFEFTLTKNRGDWIQGFINYTYDVRTSGNFGFGTYFENLAEQRRYERETRSNYQEKPLARPYARISVDVFTPEEFGPPLGGVNMFGDWRLNIVGQWKSGYYFTWANGGTLPGVENNIQWQDFYDVDMRLSKSFKIFSSINIQFFMDITNLLNYKYMTGGGFVDVNDYLGYMRSLHFSQDVFTDYPKNPDGSINVGYSNSSDGVIYEFGDDTPGDVRTGPYHAWDPNADEATKEEWKKSKSYIDMSNQGFLAFLNPRDIFWGLKVTIEIF